MVNLTSLFACAPHFLLCCHANSQTKAADCVSDHLQHDEHLSNAISVHSKFAGIQGYYRLNTGPQKLHDVGTVAPHHNLNLLGEFAQAVRRHP